MSTPKADRPEEPRDRSAPADDAANKQTKQDETKADAKKYVFKILPADPKNAFDFEDVADK